MKTSLIICGKTETDFLKKGCDDYLKRLDHYCKLEVIVLPEIKNTKNITEAEIREKEAALQEKFFIKSNYVVLLDEKGRSFTSVDFALFIEHKQQSGIKNLIFLIGGAYGFSERIKQQADFALSLSPMTFTHQMVRLIFLEQLYRAFTIIRKEKYHH